MISDASLRNTYYRENKGLRILYPYYYRRNPFWGVCPVKSCCEEKTLQHCGECKDFPCTQLNEFAYAEKEGDCGVRLDQCKIWSALTQMRYAWIDDFLMKKTGVTK